MLLLCDVSIPASAARLECQDLLVSETPAIHMLTRAFLCLFTASNTWKETVQRIQQYGRGGDAIMLSHWAVHPTLGLHLQRNCGF